MDIVFQAIEDIKKGQYVKLDIESGEISVIDSDEPKLQPKEEPNIIEGNHEGT